MLRSPFLFLFTFFLFLSCQEKTPLSVKPKSNEKYGVVLQKKGIDHFQKSNYNSSFYYFNKSNIIFETTKDSGNIVFNLIQMANIQQINGDYYGSKETLTEALQYSRNDNFTPAINNFFGIADKELSLYNDAVYYYNQAIKGLKDSNLRQSPLNNIAVIYIKQKKYDTAIQILESILDKKFSDDKISLKSKSRVIDNLGFAYFKKGMDEKGLQYLNEGLKLRIQLDDDYGCIGSYLHLAEYYAEINIQKSTDYAKKAYETATLFNSVDERLKALSFLISSGSGTKYAQKYILINDSIIHIRNNFKNKFAKIKYDSKKEKDENQKLRLEKVENQLSLQKAWSQKIFLGIAIGFLAIAIIVLIIYFRNRNRNEKIKASIQASYDTETRIAKNIHDELANDVFQAMTFTQTQSLTKDEVKENLVQKLDDIYSRVRGISRENNGIDANENFSDNIKQMLATYNNATTNVITRNIEKINWEGIDEIKKATIHRVLQELMVNMAKHSQAPVVSIQFESNQKTFLIDYADTGKGCDKNKIIKNGLQNMENRIRAIKGTITFDTEPNKGFKVKITLPK